MPRTEVFVTGKLYNNKHYSNDDYLPLMAISILHRSYFHLRYIVQQSEHWALTKPFQVIDLTKTRVWFPRTSLSWPSDYIFWRSYYAITFDPFIRSPGRASIVVRSSRISVFLLLSAVYNNKGVTTHRVQTQIREISRAVPVSQGTHRLHE